MNPVLVESESMSMIETELSNIENDICLLIDRVKEMETNLTPILCPESPPRGEKKGVEREELLPLLSCLDWKNSGQNF